MLWMFERKKNKHKTWGSVFWEGQRRNRDRQPQTAARANCKNSWSRVQYTVLVLPYSKIMWTRPQKHWDMDFCCSLLEQMRALKSFYNSSQSLGLFFGMLHFYVFLHVFVKVLLSWIQYAGELDRLCNRRTPPALGQRCNIAFFICQGVYFFPFNDSISLVSWVYFLQWSG